MQPAIINIFEKAAKKAGKILIRDFGEIENLQIHSKSIGDFVTNADLKVEKNLLETLKYYFPNYTYISEEAGEIKGDENIIIICLLYTSPSPRDATLSRMPSSA